MEDGCEICADEDLIDKIINGQLLLLGEIFEQSIKQPECTVGMNRCEGL